jgi:hypothetical protein
LPNIIGMDFLKKKQAGVHLEPSSVKFVLEFKST